MDLVIRNATIAGHPGVSDIGIRNGLIAELAQRVEVKGDQELDAAKNLVAPGFVDVHMHLDKALTLDRYSWAGREYQSTSRLTSVTESNKMKRFFTVDDVRERAVRIARLCCAHGTTSIRTHVDVDPIVGLVGLQGVLEAREACRGYVDIQVDAYGIGGFHDAPETEQLLREGLDLGADLVGGVPESDPDGHEHIDHIFAIAKDYDKDIDFHVDQVQAPLPFSLDYVAEKTIQEGMQGRVMASHCFALGHVTAEARHRAIMLCKEADISICVTPYTTIQERVLEPHAEGVNVTYMSDNTQDAWQPFGNGDMLLLALFVSRLGSWRSNDELDNIMKMGSLGAARSIGKVNQYGVEVGKGADLVIFDARSGHEAIVNQSRKSWVIKNGNIVARNGELLV